MINNETISEALASNGYKDFSVTGDSFDGIVWIEKPASTPTKAKLNQLVETYLLDKEVKLNQMKKNKESALLKLQELGLTVDELKSIL